MANKPSTRLLRPYRGRTAALCAITVLTSLLQVCTALVTRDVVDAAMAGEQSLFTWGALLIAILAALVLLNALHGWLGGSTADRCVAQLRHSLLQCMAYSEDEKMYAYHSGALLSRGMEDVRTVCDGMVNVLPSMVGNLVRLAASFAAAVLLLPSLTGVIALAAVVIAASAALVRPVIKRHHAKVRQADEQVMTTMQESLQNLELIKSIRAEEQILSRFDQRLGGSLLAYKRRRRWMVGRNTFISALSQLGTGVLLIWGASRVAAGTMSYGSLAAMLQLISLLRNPVLGLSGLWTRMAAVEVAQERLELLLQDVPPVQPLEISQVSAVVFEDVTFAYPDEETPVLAHFSARFDLDRWVCLTGMSGRGKTTVFKLMLGLYQPQQGRVYLQTDCGQIPCGSNTRHLFAYVPQDYALLSGSVLDNLILAAPEATAQQRAEALRLAQADFVWELSGGEQTLLRENNEGLSKGQLQRLAVARAILMDRPVFLLDECTSALDSATERALLENLLRLNKQGVLVTHRPEALEQLQGLTVKPM